jgi:hypothetical protein
MDCNVAPVDEENLADFPVSDACRDIIEVKLECGRTKDSTGSTNVVDAIRAENLGIILSSQRGVERAGFMMCVAIGRK